MITFVAIYEGVMKQMEKRRTQQWLQEIYKHPKRYEGKVVIILNDTQIVGVAEGLYRGKAQTRTVSCFLSINP